MSSREPPPRARHSIVSRRLSPQRHRLHLDQGRPLVVGLFLVTVLEMMLALVFRLPSISPQGLAQRLESNLPWLLFLWSAFTIALVLYVTGHTTSETRLTYAMLAIYTGLLVANVGALVWTLSQRVDDQAHGLLIDGLLIWAVNVLVFAIWYWLLDGGGYLMRAERSHTSWEPRDFLFPAQAAKPHDYHDWHPDFWDYVFLAFCTSTAFSPADTMTLSRRAKVLQMVQATLSLIVIALIVARAVNILGSGPDRAAMTGG
jgi:uncharacterized membrane protein